MVAARSETNMPDPVWAVVVVHGVGPTIPGRTLDSFVSTLKTSVADNRLKETGPPEVRLLDKLPERLQDHQYTDLLPEPSTAPFADRFPMHLRHVRVDKGQQGAPRKAIFAEVFWSDLSATGNGWRDILVRLFTIIFQLRFVADRAAKTQDERARWLRFVLFLTSYLLCGPVAALNVVIVILLATNFLDGWLQSWFHFSFITDQIHLVLSIIGLLGGSIVLWRGRRKRKPDDDSPWSLLLCWIGAGGLAVALLAILSGWVPAREVLDWIKPYLRSRSHPAVPPVGISLYFVALMTLRDRIFLVMLACLLVAVLCWLWASFSAWRDHRKNLVPGLTASVGALVLQIGLWVLIVPALSIWVFQQLSFDTAPGSPFAGVQVSFLMNFMLAFVVGLCVWLTWGSRRFWICQHKRNHRNLEVARTIPRLLIHPFILAVLILVVVFGSLISITGNDFVHNQLLPHAGWVNRWTAVGVTIISLCLMNFLGKGLHILMDIVSHFIMQGLPVPRPWGKERDIHIKDLVRQMKIEARFRRVLQEVLKDGNVTYLTVVTHSQGSVIAADVLWYDWTAGLLHSKNVQCLYLVTMGSPFTHLYQKYFPDRYPQLFLNGAFNDDKHTGWGRLYKTFRERPNAAWINLFRVDDPVGTYIDGGTIGSSEMPFPENYVLDPGGHTGYWSDLNALRLMRDLLPGTDRAPTHSIVGEIREEMVGRAAPEAAGEVKGNTET